MEQTQNNQNSGIGQRSTTPPTKESFGPSLIFEHYLTLAVSKCAYYGSPDDSRYCEILANMCALHLFSNDAGACSKLSEIKSDRTAYGSAAASSEWVRSVPWLKYDDTGKLVTESKEIKQKISLDAQAVTDSVDRLNLTLAKYSLNGDFLGFEPLRAQFYYCNKKSTGYDMGTTSDSGTGGTTSKPVYGPPPSGDTRWLKYGHGYSESYYCDLESLIENNETVFYDLYLNDPASGSSDVDALFPVPVRLENFVEGSKLVNVNSDNIESDDVFTRRFFFHDAVSSIKTAGAKAEVLRYADKIELEVRMQRDGNPSVSSQRTFPPILTIHYTDIKVADVVGAKKTTKITFSAVYTQDMTDLKQSFDVMAGLGYAITVFIAFVASVGTQRKNWRSGQSPGDGDPMLNFRYLIFLFSAFTKVFMVIMLVALLFIFWPFKAQVDLFIMLPVDRIERLTLNDYYLFRTFLMICFVGQLLTVLEIIYSQSKIEIFFMDWEKTRGKLANTKNAKGKALQAPISAWRSFFVANEWNELQSQRRINVPFTIILTLFILVGCDWQYHATRTPGTFHVEAKSSVIY